MALAGTSRPSSGGAGFFRNNSGPALKSGGQFADGKGTMQGTSHLALYNQSGECFRLAASDWRDLLLTARQYGWKPAGTIAPPIQWDLDRPATQERWNREYDAPKGQAVTRRDTAALAAALKKAPADRAKFSGRSNFLSFCDKGSFIICTATEVSSTMGMDLIRLGAALQEHSVQPVVVDTPSAEKPQLV